MDPVHCQAVISATSKEEADRFTVCLLEKKLIAGSLIIEGDSSYWWEGKITTNRYWNLNCYTLKEKKQEIINAIDDICKDEVPIICLTEIDGNESFLKWIEENVV